MRCLEISELDFVAGGLDYASPEGLGDSNGDGIGDIVIVGERMDWWDKLVEDVKDFFSSDSPNQPHDSTPTIETPEYTYEPGMYYGSVGAILPIGFGASVTVTSQGDVLVTGHSGSPGPIVTVGATPPGTNASYLEGGAISANLPTGAGVSIPAGGSLNDAHATWGTPGFNYGQTVNVSDPAIEAAQAAAEHAQAEAIRIANEAQAWADQRSGLINHNP